MKTYSEAVQFLDRFINYEKSMERLVYNKTYLDLERFNNFLARWDIPQSSSNFIHIAGTKGKGSTAAILEAALIHAGLHVGLYTSPHLETYLERFRVDGQTITEHRFVMYMNELSGYLEQNTNTHKGNFRTVFEILTTIAFLFFRDEKVDLAIMETGLGGRLDATNVIHPQLTIITALGLDHTHLLGDTITNIAREKGGIIKNHIPLILAAQEEATQDLTIPILRNICEIRKAPFIETVNRVEILGSELNIPVYESGTIPGQKIRFRLPNGEFETFLPLLGRHQVENCRTAITALTELDQQRFPIILDKAFEGISKTNWPGRFEIIPGSPLIILDGAHCPLSARALVKTLDAYLPDQPRIFILGILKGKDIQGIVRELTQNPLCREIITISSPSPRGFKADELATLIKGIFPSVKIAHTPDKAVHKSLKSIDQKGVIIVTGSLYNLDMIKKLLVKNKQ